MAQITTTQVIVAATEAEWASVKLEIAESTIPGLSVQFDEAGKAATLSYVTNLQVE